MMRALLWIVLVAAGAWAAYWFIGSNALDAGARAWFEQRRAEGWQAEYQELGVRGFPNRFDMVLTDPALADPETGLAWQADRLDVMALSYRPNHVIVAFQPQQLLATPLGKTRIESRDMKASLVTDPAPSLPLERVTLVADAVSLVALPERTGGTTRIEALTAAAERVTGTQDRYRLGLNAQGLRPALPFKDRVDPENRLPETLDAFRADVEMSFDKAWDRSAIEEARPQPTMIDIALAEARWGTLELALAGKVEIRDGLPAGRIVIKARNWRELLNMADAAIGLPRQLRDGLERALSLAAGLSGNASTLDVPLEFKSGRTWIGPLPVGPAPRIVLR